MKGRRYNNDDNCINYFATAIAIEIILLMAPNSGLNSNLLPTANKGFASILSISRSTDRHLCEVVKRASSTSGIKVFMTERAAPGPVR